VYVFGYLGESGMTCCTGWTGGRGCRCTCGGYLGKSGMTYCTVQPGEVGEGM
jgi:hypothetical protein